MGSGLHDTHANPQFKKRKKKKKYQALLACTTSVFVFRNGGAWERGYTETPETWIPPYYGHTAVHGPSGGPNGVHFGVVSLCTCATHC